MGSRGLQDILMADRGITDITPLVLRYREEIAKYLGDDLTQEPFEVSVAYHYFYPDGTEITDPKKIQRIKELNGWEDE